MEFADDKIDEFFILQNWLFAIWKQYLPFPLPGRQSWTNKARKSGRIGQIERKHRFVPNNI